MKWHNNANTLGQVKASGRSSLYSFLPPVMAGVIFKRRYGVRSCNHS